MCLLASSTVFGISSLLCPEAGPVQVSVLRGQQIRLGLLKAACVLFSQQDNLRQIMSHSADTEAEEYSLFQQLLGAATRPSTIKALFERDELEVSGQALTASHMCTVSYAPCVCRRQLSQFASIWQWK